jgi:plasmid stability protein
MPSIQVKDVPDDVHATLRRRAQEAGMSLQEYLLAHLSSEARSPTLNEVLERLNTRSGGRAAQQTVVEIIRAERDAR